MPPSSKFRSDRLDWNWNISYTCWRMWSFTPSKYLESKHLESKILAHTLYCTFSLCECLVSCSHLANYSCVGSGCVQWSLEAWNAGPCFFLTVLHAHGSLLGTVCQMFLCTIIGCLNWSWDASCVSEMHWFPLVLAQLILQYTIIWLSEIISS